MVTTPLNVEHWINEVYPVIACHAKEQGALIYWGDETAVVQDGHLVRGYAPAGQTPVLEQSMQLRHGVPPKQPTLAAQASAMLDCAPARRCPDTEPEGRIARCTAA